MRGYLSQVAVPQDYLSISVTRARLKSIRTNEPLEMRATSVLQPRLKKKKKEFLTQCKLGKERTRPELASRRNDRDEKKKNLMIHWSLTT